MSNWEAEAGELPSTESHLRLCSETLSYVEEEEQEEEENSLYIQNNKMGRQLRALAMQS